MFRVERTRHIFKGYGSIIRFASNKDRIVVSLRRYFVSYDIDSPLTRS